MNGQVYKELFQMFLQKPLLRLKRLALAPSKTLLTFLWNKYLKLAKIIPGADVIFLGIFLKEIKMYVLYPFHLNEFCGGGFWQWFYDIYVTWFIVSGFVIYLTRRYILSRKTS